MLHVDRVRTEKPIPIDGTDDQDVACDPARVGRDARPIYFTMESRPAFKPDCVIHADNYAGIIGHYILPVVERVRCRVLRVHRPIDLAERATARAFWR